MKNSIVLLYCVLNLFMINRSKFVMCFIILLTASSCEKDKAGVNPSSPEVLAALNQVAIPIQGSGPSLPETDLTVFNTLLSGSKIVGMGEVSHGSKECFEMKHRLFAYGVKNHQYKAIGFETSYIDGYLINQYVQGKNITLGGTTLQIKNVISEPWATQEVLNLVNWMRDYNQTHAQKISFYGFDIQYFASDSYIVLEDYLKKVSDLNEWSAILANLNKYTTTLEYVVYEYHKIPESEKNFYRLNIQNAKAKLQQKRNAYITASSEAEFKEIAFLLEIAQKAEQHYSSVTEVQTSAEFITVGNRRDRLMAESIAFYRENVINNVKTMVWAHNSHVFNKNAEGKQTMGYHLKNKEGDDGYGIISFALTKGAIRAIGTSGMYQPVTISDATVNNSLNATFTKATAKQFALIVNNTPPLLRSFLSNTTMFNTGAGYAAQYHNATFEKVNLNTLTDIIIYFDVSSAATGL